MRNDLVSTLTRRVLFAPLDGPGRADTVAQRLRSAIALGVLAEGDVLPSEAELAAQFPGTDSACAANTAAPDARRTSLAAGASLSFSGHDASHECHYQNHEKMRAHRPTCKGTL